METNSFLLVSERGQRNGSIEKMSYTNSNLEKLDIYKWSQKGRNNIQEQAFVQPSIEEDIDQ